MIKTAVIMAAGVGSRFGSHTLDKPKGFVNVGGKEMIVRSIENLICIGIEKIIVGVGYMSSFYEDLAETYPQIVCCKSDKYAETNSMYTLYVCNELIGNDNFLLLESDLIYEQKGLHVLINSNYSNAILVTPFTKEQDGYYMKVNSRGILSDCTTDVSKRDDFTGELVGIHKLSNQTYKRMYDWYDKIWFEKPKLGYEFALLEMARSGEEIYLLKEEIYWYEIDDESDLLYAEKNVIPFL